MAAGGDGPQDECSQCHLATAVGVRQEVVAEYPVHQGVALCLITQSASCRAVAVAAVSSRSR
jgi:hypothetical protein